MLQFCVKNKNVKIKKFMQPIHLKHTMSFNIRLTQKEKDYYFNNIYNYFVLTLVVYDFVLNYLVSQPLWNDVFNEYTNIIDDLMITLYLFFKKYNYFCQRLKPIDLVIKC